MTGVETLVRVSKRGAGVSRHVAGGRNGCWCVEIWGFEIHGWGLESLETRDWGRKVQVRFEVSGGGGSTRT